jgi:hypothetical protein
MNRSTLRTPLPVVAALFLSASSLLVVSLLAEDQGKTKTESFDADPSWHGVNNRSARTEAPVTIRQDFGYSRSANAGGRRGEIGGTISPAGEVAYYAKVIEPKTFRDPLRASGTFSCPDGAYHVLLGFFHAASAKEWRTSNTIALRLNGRGDHFYAYVEYCTSKWRAGGDTTPFPSTVDPETGRWNLIGFPSGGKVHEWSLTYDPEGNDGGGVVHATMDDKTAICLLDKDHKADGAVFDRFGLLNILKSVDTAGEVYFDDIEVDGAADSFDEDPKWEGKNNRRTYDSAIVRPRFDFGFSPTHFAGGKSTGELGGMIFRGDCRYPERMGSYGDAIGPLSLERPFRAAGKVALRRGVSDSTTLFGFFNSRDSMRRNDSQKDGLPESVAGIHIEGPSSEGFRFYPVYRANGKDGRYAPARECPRIYPDGKTHDWTFDYDPAGAGGKGQIVVSLDGEAFAFDLEDGAKASGTEFDRFGIVTSWVDGNSQDVYWDDVTYTVSQ